MDCRSGGGALSRGRALGPGRLSKREGSYVLDYTDDRGKRRRRGLGCDKRVAERRRAEIMRRRDMALDGLGAVEGQDLLLVEIAQDYLLDLSTRVSPKHWVNVRSRLERTLEGFGDARVRDLKPMDVVRMRSQAVSAGAAHRTANLIGATLSAMLRWAVEMDLIAKNPIGSLKPLPERGEHRRYQRRALSDQEIQRFLQASERDDQNAARCSKAKGLHRIPQTLLWRALLDTGARWNELRQIEWRDLDTAKGIMVLRAESSKSRKLRVIPVTADFTVSIGALQLLHQQVAGRIVPATDRVFLTPAGCNWGQSTNNPMRIFDRVLSKAGIVKYSADGTKLDIHALRHTFATRLARSGAPLLHAQRLLGHSDPKLTAQVYTHLDAEDMRGSIEGMMGPRAQSESAVGRSALG